MMKRFRHRLVLCLVLSVLPFSGPAWAQQTVADRIDRLEQEIAALKQQLQTQDQEQKRHQAEQLAAREEQEEIQLAAEKAAAMKPKVEMGKDGLKVTSAVGNYSLRIRGYMQADSRSFINDDQDLNVDTLLIRRARPIVEGTAGDFAFRIMPDFAGGSTRLFDAYAEYKPGARFNIRTGKFKTPFGLDRLKSATDLAFAERSMPTNLAPNRDTGLMVYGAVNPQLSYELGVFNGAEDLGNIDSDADDKKEIAARLFAQPFTQSNSALKGLGFGVAGTWGKKDGSLSSRQVGDYRSPSLARVFRYRSSTFADGDHWRIAPQGYFYKGPFGLQAEYTLSSQEVSNGGNVVKIENSAWETQFSYLLTGQNAAFKGWPAPDNPFNPWLGYWGAWEIAAKYGVLDVDDKAFPVYADPAASVRQARNFGLALHGYLSENVRFSLDYENTRFDGGAQSGADRDTEQVIMTRLDYKF